MSTQTEMPLGGEPPERGSVETKAPPEPQWERWCVVGYMLGKVHLRNLDGAYVEATAHTDRWLIPGWVDVAFAPKSAAPHVTHSRRNVDRDLPQAWNMVRVCR